jgi:hypothetical protein
MTPIDPATLNRHWVHSHEEDTEDEQVFRPASYAFPPSRGRSGLDLHPDGSYGESVPGPTDRPEETEGGTWELDGDTLELRAPDGSMHVLKIASATPDRLVVKK